MSDRITLKGLRVKGFHGVYENERRDGQQFVLDVSLDLDLAPAAASDDVADTVHYGHLAVGLAGILRGPSVNLLETLAQRCADLCLNDPRVAAVEVVLHKPQAPIAEEFDDVSVTLRRTRSPVPGEPVTGVLALGSNLGDRLATLQSGVDALAAAVGVEVLRVSPVVETAPVGGPEQPDYLNAVLEVRTSLAAHDLIRLTQRIESEHGRRRDVRWGPRTLDIDLVVLGEQVVATPDLELPHPRAAQRGFVFVPWALLDPDAVIPGAGRVGVLATTAADADGVRRRDDLVLTVPGPWRPERPS